MSRRRSAVVASVLAPAAIAAVGDGERARATGTAAGAEGPPDPVTGPPAQRLNLIILGDGYRADQQSLFFADVDRNLSVMWATEPFRSYRNYLNVHAVEIASIDYASAATRTAACGIPTARSATPASAKGRSTARTPRCG